VTVPTVGPAPADAMIEDTQAFWRETGKSLVRGSFSTLEDTAKQLIAVPGVLIGLYFHAITFGDLKGRVDGWSQLLYLAPMALLAIALVFALLVFFPDRSRLNINSWEASKLVYERTLRSKLRAVRLASIFTLLGVVAVIAASAVYLRG